MTRESSASTPIHIMMNILTCIETVSPIVCNHDKPLFHANVHCIKKGLRSDSFILGHNGLILALHDLVQIFIDWQYITQYYFKTTHLSSDSEIYLTNVVPRCLVRYPYSTGIAVVMDNVL